MRIPHIILILIGLLSISFNAAFIIHLFTSHPGNTEASINPMPLNLTEQQKKQIEPLRLKIHKDNEAIKAEIRQCQGKLMAALKTHPVDKQAIYQCIDNISNLQKKIQQNTIEEIIQVTQFMNPEQCTCLMEELSKSLHQEVKPCTCPSCATRNPIKKSN